MIFVVALDPESIKACSRQGEIGFDHLVGVFQALLQNCLMAEIDGTWRLGPELVDAAKNIPDQDARKKIMTILERLMDPNHYRFVPVISGFEGDHETETGAILASQTTNTDLDLVVCEDETILGPVEAVRIHRFNQSNFARDRSRRACAIVCAPGTRVADELLAEAFGRLLRHAEIVTIFDRVMGKQFKDNYFDGLGHWCAFFRQMKRNYLVRFHTTGGQERSIKNKLAQELDGSGVDYDVVVHEENSQPHDRFLRAAGFTLDIGRGVDLFDYKGECRDVKIGLSDHGSFTREWGHL
jgi:hypothetical protein